ncbi:Hypothetical protein XNRR2_1268 [Streptomyces albidoflavus]|jgi:hypothetical protein|nr:Hypothetical protein XNR_1268 [Streptomyces albidoflavus]SCD51254.1 hypothetical protein GA0115236_10952 [Streptomyces sp. IgraMP-1]SCD76518.1 hypothetical protein GA0115250_12132 [Streptomyces sp. BvitLS-983]AMM08059.1 hypothetical protein Salbus254_1529 [Streptomyces albidoflavus]QLP91428.1 Hypothetical protein XNRR2_1268 [Streptomyces albidoflavus]
MFSLTLYWDDASGTRTGTARGRTHHRQILDADKGHSSR